MTIAFTTLHRRLELCLLAILVLTCFSLAAFVTFFLHTESMPLLERMLLAAAIGAIAMTFGAQVERIAFIIARWITPPTERGTLPPFNLWSQERRHAWLDRGQGR